MPAQMTLQLVESLKALGSEAHYNLAKLREGECVSILFQGSRVAVLLCRVEMNTFLIAAKPIPPHMKL
ncbi:MAG: hypothetical protein DRJ67_07775 [Thermoprotei archaeon]|nr:MAG: hypothetical protein DRJ67_07775 [Thermoprotei archaeon]